MFKRICLKVNAENPQLPLMPSEPFEGSAATFEISGVPRAFARRRITGVSVNITNVDGQTAALACVFEGGVWSCTVPSAAIGASGFVGNGVIIAASGTDETGAAVPCWILGAGDLKVRRQDGTIEPGATLQTLHWFDERPESPKAGDVAPSPDDQSVLELFDGKAWRGFGGGVKIAFDDEPTEGSKNAARSGGIWSWVKRLLAGKLDKSGGTITGGLTFEGDHFGIKFNDNHQSISFSNGNNIGQYGLLIQGKAINYPSASGTFALTSDIPAPVAVIDPAVSTTTGKAADALKVKQALDAKQSDLGASVDENMYASFPSGIRANSDVLAMWYEVIDANAHGELSAYTESDDDPNREHMHIRTFADSDRSLPSGDIVVPRKNGVMALTSDIPNVRYPFGAPITASAILADRTRNRVNALSTLTDAIDLSFPAAVEGMGCDFLVRVHRETGGVAINFTVPTGAVVFGDGFASAIGEGEDWLYAITEIAANEWYVRAIKLEVAE